MKTLKRIGFGLFWTIWSGIADKLCKESIEELDETIDQTKEEIGNADTTKGKVKKVVAFCGWHFVRCVMWLTRVFNAGIGAIFFCSMFVSGDYEQEYIEEQEE